MLPNSGITTTLVGNELGTSSHAVSELCTHANIRSNAKYKPTRYTGNDPNLWWKADDGGCGYSIPISTSYSAIADGAEWFRYLPDRAGDAKRLGDFRGYNLQATTSPIKLFNIHNGDTVMFDPTMDLGIGVTFDINRETSKNELLVTDIERIKPFYPCLLIYQGNDKTKVPLIITADTTIGATNSNRYITILVPWNVIGSGRNIYGVYSCLTDIQRSVSNPPPSFNTPTPGAKFIPMPTNEDGETYNYFIANVSSGGGGGGNVLYPVATDVSNLINGVYNTVSYHKVTPLVTQGGLFVKIMINNTTRDPVLISNTVGASSKKLTMRVTRVDGTTSTSDITMYVNGSVASSITVPSGLSKEVIMGSNSILTQGAASSSNRQYDCNLYVDINGESSSNTIRLQYTK